VEDYRRALAIDRASAETWNKLGETLMTLGRVDEAITCLRQAVARHPNLVAAQCALAAAGQPDAEVPLTRLFAQQGVPKADKLRWALPRRSYVIEPVRGMRLSHASRRRARTRMAASGQSFDAAAVRAYVKQQIDGCTVRFSGVGSRVGNTSELPVFAVGMPRSGIRLVEQALASHSNALDMGESNAIGAIDAELAQSAVFRHLWQ
jgi:tetratricopeptide (TPR) repeat protein